MTTTKNNEHKKLNFSNEREQSQACLNSAEHEKNQGRKVLNVPNSTDKGNVIRNVPHLRFPEYEGEWEKKRLEECVDFLDGLRKPIKSEDRKSEQGLYPYYGASGIIDYIDGYIFDGEYILLSEDGANIIDRNYRVAFIAKGKIWVNNHAHVLQPYDGFDINFLSETLERLNYAVYNTGTTMPKLNQEVCRNINLKIPTTKEQNKIGNLLSLLNKRIATQNKIIEDLKKLKSAIIEKLYSEIQGKEYSYRQLFDVVNERNKQMEYSNILSASQEKGMVNRDDLNLDIQFEHSNINTYKIVRKGDYVIHLRSFQGGFAFSDKLGVCSPAYTILRPNSLLEYSYLSNYFTSQRFIKSLVLVTYGIRDGRSINVDEWLRMKITIPPKEHQQYIVKMIGSFDRKIESEEAYTILLSKQKQYILRQMFI